jgi:TrmH family RNA methyltransferase
METIASKQHPWIKRWRALQSPHTAKKERRIRVEGVRHVADVVASGGKIDALFFSDDDAGRAAAEAIGNDCFAEVTRTVAPHLFATLTDATTPQGVAAIARLQNTTLEEVLAAAPARLAVLVLDGVQDPGNVGTLIRTADALAFDAVILGEGTASVWNPKTVAATMGSLFHIPVIEWRRPLADAMACLQARGIRVLGADLNGETVDLDWRAPARVALVLGNEGRGLDPDTVDRVDTTVTLAMPGGAESLNVATAGAILMWVVAGSRPL